MTTLVLAEHDNKAPQEATSKALTAAKALGGDVHVLVAGEDCKPVAEDAAKLDGVAKVLVAETPSYAHGLAEPLAALLVSLAGDYDAIVAPATTIGKNVMPRVAALIDVTQISDISRSWRPIPSCARSMPATRSRPCSRPTPRRSSPCAPRPSRQRPKAARRRSRTRRRRRSGLSTFVGEELSKSDRPELTAAKIVISGGRGMQSGDNFTIFMEQIADKLGAAVGASRAAVDAGFVPNDLQVGQTGKIVAPELYIAVGISGAIQHLAGMKDSKVIVAINKDEEAPIFQVADYGLVADLFQALPELAAELGKLGR